MMLDAFSTPPFEITIEEYQTFFHSEKPHFLLDIREPYEIDIVFLEKANFIPLGLLENQIDKLPKDQWIIIYCHHGVRSLRACHLLRQKGFDKVMSLKGGIHRWAEIVDPRIPTY